MTYTLTILMLIAGQPFAEVTLPGYPTEPDCQSSGMLVVARIYQGKALNGSVEIICEESKDDDA